MDFLQHLDIHAGPTSSSHYCSRRHSKENVVSIRGKRVLELAGVIYNHHPIMSFCILLHVYTYVCHPERAVQIRTLNSTWQSEELKVEARSVTGGKEGSVTYSFGWPVRPTSSPSSLPSRPGPSGLKDESTLS